MGGKLLRRAEEIVACASTVNAGRLTSGMEIEVSFVEEKKANYWGTPLAYATKKMGCGKEIVEYLLEKGADPTTKTAGEFVMHLVERSLLRTTKLRRCYAVGLSSMNFRHELPFKHPTASLRTGNLSIY